MLAARVEPKNGPGGGCRNRGQICRFALCRVSPIFVTTDHVCALSGFTKSSVNGFVLVSAKAISWLNPNPPAIGMYAAWPAFPSAPATLAAGRPATAFPAPVFHLLECS